MSKHRITTTHPAFGEVVFIIEADSDARAFQLWKSVVFSARQWVVKFNELVAEEAA
jgi:hypothetical protein